MNNTLYHFGDSFGTWGNKDYPELEAKKGFSEYIADYYNLNFEHYAHAGYSNQQIISSIIKNYNKFKNGDFILINWSFLHRCVYLNKHNGVHTTSDLIHGFDPNNLNLNYMVNRFKLDNVDYLKYLLFQKSEFTKQEAILLFKMIINPLLKNLIDVGCNVINTFNDNSLGFNQGTLNISSNLLEDSIKKINWGDEDGGEYIWFINKMGYRNDSEDQHYKFGIQEELANHWIDKINKQILKK